MSLRKILLSKEIIEGGIWLFLERGFFTLKGFILSLAFANLLSPEAFGAYQFTLSILGTLCVLALPGMATAMVQALARKKDRVYYIGVKEMFRWSLWGVPLLFFVWIYAQVRYPSVALAILFVLPLFPLYAVVVGSWRAYFTGREQFIMAAKIGMLGEGTNLVAILILLSISSRVEALVLAATLPSTLVYGISLWKNWKETEKGDFDESNVRFGKRLSWLYAAGTIATYFDRLVVAHFLGLGQLAVFAMASIIPDQIRDSVRVIVGYVLPGFSRMDDQPENRRLILRGVKTLSLLVAIAVVMYIFASPWIFRWLFPQYVNVIPYTQVAALVSLTVPYMILDSYFRAIKDDRTATTAALSGYVVGTVLNLILIPAFGIWGALIARIVSLSTNATIFLVAFLKK